MPGPALPPPPRTMSLLLLSLLLASLLPPSYGNKGECVGVGALNQGSGERLGGGAG